MNSTILLIEDSPDDVFFMKRAFRLAGVHSNLQVVDDGEKALEYLSGNGAFVERAQYPLPGLVLLDLRLPRVPGFEVLKWIRENSTFQCVPVVVLTSSKEDRDMQRAYALGANSFLVKPSDANELAEMVRTLCNYWFRFNAIPSPCAESIN